MRFLCYLPRKHVWLHLARRNSSLPSAGTLLHVGLRATMIPRMIARTVGRPTIGARRGFAKRASLPVCLPGTAPVVPSGPFAKEPTRNVFIYFYVRFYEQDANTTQRVSLRVEYACVAVTWSMMKIREKLALSVLTLINFLAFPVVNF